MRPTDLSLDFLLACLSGSTSELEARPDPGDLAAFAEHHGLTPCLHQHLPDSFWRDRYMAHARRNLCLIAETAAVLECLARNGIRGLVLKGPLLAQQLYGDFALRQCGDIDVLVEPSRAADAIRALTCHGYRLSVPLSWISPSTAVGWNSELPFRGPNGIDVDLHWCLAPSHSVLRLDPAVLFGSTTTVSAAGREFPVPTPEPLLLFLIVHGSRHLWERLVWIADVAALTRQHLDWQAVWRLARRYHLESAVRVALALVREFAAAGFPFPLSRREQAAVDVCARRLRAGVIPEPGTIELIRFQTLIAPGHVAVARHLSGLLLEPTENDWRMARLRPPFSVLYYPLRVGRLVFGCSRNLRYLWQRP